MASKLCDSCKSATATLYCRPDSAFLCGACDSKIHGANKLASRHPRVSLCEVCEQAPAHVTCKADAASLCIACDHDIHSANPLAARHDRIPVVPFFHSLHSVKSSSLNFHDNNHHHRFFSSNDDADEDAAEDAEEAASWLLPNPKADLFPESEPLPFIDLDYGTLEHKTDGVVPVQNASFEPFSYAYNYKDNNNNNNNTQSQSQSQTETPSQSQMSHSVSSSSMEVGVVPEGSAVSEISNCGGYDKSDREARVLRYREKRKNRRFEKTIRYASRKAYAETRPRIKGRFAKRTSTDPLPAGYGVVPTC